jgi:hypothetical protein
VNSPFLLNGTPLPDARLDLWARRKRTEVVWGSLRIERVYCVNCGKAGGGAPLGSPVFFLCDDCVATWGPPPGCIEVTTDGL